MASSMEGVYPMHSFLSCPKCDVCKPNPLLILIENEEQQIPQ